MTYANISVEDVAGDQADRVIKIVKVSGQLDESKKEGLFRRVSTSIELTQKTVSEAAEGIREQVKSGQITID